MEYSLIILLLPMVMFLVLGLFGHKMSHRVAGLLGTTGLAVITALAYTVAVQYFSMPRIDGKFTTLIPVNFEWLRFTDALHIDLGILLDPISVMMLVVITTVSLMVHIYSMGYMHGEVGFQRYFAFLSLFSFSMLGLVVATNIFQIYFLGAGGCIILFAYRVLLYKAFSCVSFEKGIYCDSFCRFRILDRNSYFVLFCTNFRFQYAYHGKCFEFNGW